MADGIEREQGIEVNGIANLTLFRILLGHNIVVHIAAEIAIITEHALCHRCTEGRIDLTHQHGWLSKSFGHPFGKARGFAGVFVVYPKVP